MTTVALLFVNYGPYHLARLKGFQQHCDRRGWRAIGIELTRSDADYAWKTDLENFSDSVISVLGEQPIERVPFVQLIRKLYAILSEIQPDAIAIAGYFQPAFLAALGWCIWHRHPAILLSESKQDDAPRKLWREALKMAILKGYKAALVGGKPHKRYAIALGMPPDAIFSGYNTVGNAVFHPDSIRQLPAPLGRSYFLSVNRFIPKKNLPRLLDAYRIYRQQTRSDPWDLVLCGDGELRELLERKIHELHLTNHVHLTGFLQQQEILPYYAHAGCLIHASAQEQWGLVVNEAMASGLPVLVSDRCGCYEDLVLETITGFGFDPDNTQQLAELMVKIASNEIDRREMGSAALDRIQHFSPDYFARGLTQAVDYALTH